MEPEGHHRHPIQSESPGDDRHVDAQRIGHFRTKQTGPAQLHPSQAGVLDVQFDGWLRKGEVGREKLALLGLGDFTGEEVQEPQQDREIDIRGQHDAFDLEEIAGMGGIDMVVAEAARDREVLPGDLGAGSQRPGRHGGALAAKHQSPGPLPIVGVAPAGRAGRAAVLMGGGHLTQVGFGDRHPMRRRFHEVHIVNVPSRMKLGHEQRVHIPEFGLDQRAPHLLEAHAHQLPLDQIEKFPIGMPSAHRLARGAQADGVLSKTRLPPGPILEQVRRELREVLGRTLTGQRRRGRLAALRKAVVAAHMVVDAEGLVGIAALHRIPLDDGAGGLGEPGHLAGGAVQVLQRAPDRLGGGARHAGGFDEAAGHHPERPFLLEATDGGADFGRFEPLLGLELADGQPFPGLIGRADCGQNAFDGRVLFEIPLSDFRQGGDRRDRLRLHAQQPLREQPLDGHTELRGFEPRCLRDLFLAQRTLPDRLGKGEQHFDLERMQAVQCGG